MKLVDLVKAGATAGGRMKVPESLEDVHAALGLPPDWVPTTAEETEFFYERALDLFRAPTASGFYCVTKSGKQWQAKVTVRGSQKILGRHLRPRQAAADVMSFCIGSLPAPPSPTSLRNKRGLGPREDSRHGKRRAAAVRSLPAAEPLVVVTGEWEASEVPPADALVVPCERIV